MINDIIMCLTVFVMGFFSYDLFLADANVLKSLSKGELSFLTKVSPQKIEQDIKTTVLAPYFDEGKKYFYKADGVIRNLTPAELKDSEFVKKLMQSGKILEAPAENGSAEVASVSGEKKKTPAEAIKEMKEKTKAHTEALKQFEE